MNKYFIERVQIEGGFLDGFDVSLKSGLNTIIGARGTGKSTLVELIRYCLGIKGHTSDSHSKALSHARSVLKDGQIIVTIKSGDESFKYSRTSESETSPPFPKHGTPLIFSQSEVENIGLLSSGRLGLIDEFTLGLEELKSRELTSISLIDSYSLQIQSLISHINDSEDKLATLPTLYTHLHELESEEKKISEVSLQAGLKSDELKVLGEEYTKQFTAIEETKNEISSDTKFREELLNIIATKGNLDQVIHQAKHPTKSGAFRIDAINLINSAIEKLNNSIKFSESELEVLEKSQAVTTYRGQSLRAEVDKLKAGAGEISRKTQHLRSDISQLELLKLSSSEKNEQVKSLQNMRDEILDSLEKIRSERSQVRFTICQKLTNELSPKIRIMIEEGSQIEEYKQTLINALKGSGIRYNDLAPIIAETIPPRVLLNIVESNDTAGFISLISISLDRASRVIHSLKSAIDKISTVILEDEISFELLDGTEYKNFSELSTGQRCTVILPLVLEHQETILIVDQPEDHIDNAFIVDTLIKSITKRSDSSQIIVTTHNANVPVLGNASEVIHLNSDGTRGFVVSEGNLQNSNIIDAISNVMEGGREAFKYRASFYG